MKNVYQASGRKQREKVGVCLSADNKNRMTFLQTIFFQSAKCDFYTMYDTGQKAAGPWISADYDQSIIISLSSSRWKMCDS